jgi:hypothetical protein
VSARGNRPRRAPTSLDPAIGQLQHPPPRPDGPQRPPRPACRLRRRQRVDQRVLGVHPGPARLGRPRAPPLVGGAHPRPRLGAVGRPQPPLPHGLDDVTGPRLAPPGLGDFRPPPRVAVLRLALLAPRGGAGLVGEVGPQPVRALVDVPDAQRPAPEANGLRRDSPVVCDRGGALPADGLGQVAAEDERAGPLVATGARGGGPRPSPAGARRWASARPRRARPGCGAATRLRVPNPRAARERRPGRACPGPR